MATYLGNTADDVLLAALPLSFDAGFSQLTTAFAVGAHVILMNYLLPGDVPRLCARHGVTGLTCVPPLWIQIVEQKWPEDARASLRYFANTGGRMPKPILDKLREVFPSAKPFLMYGLTEAFRSTYLDPAEVDRRPDSIGKAIPGAEILVVRPDGSPCDPGEEGELVHRGPHVALGYWNDPVRTAERFRPVPGRDEPWRTPELAVWSGDTVITDDEGFLYFVGRKDEMIKTSGYRVSPTEIEEVAYATGLVRDAVALGVEDATLGQRVLLGGGTGRRGVRHRRAARGDEVPAAAVHGAQLSCGSRRDSSLTQRQVRPGIVARGVGRREPAPHDRGVRQHRRSACRGWDAAGPPHRTRWVHTVLRLRSPTLDRACRIAASNAAADAAPQLRGEGQPDAGGRTTPRGPRRCAGCRLDARDADRTRYPDARRPGSVSPGRARPRRRSCRPSRQA